MTEREKMNECMCEKVVYCSLGNAVFIKNVPDI